MRKSLACSPGAAGSGRPRSEPRSDQAAGSPTGGEEGAEPWGWEPSTSRHLQAPPSTSRHLPAPPGALSLDRPGLPRQPRTTRVPPPGLVCHPAAKARPRRSLPAPQLSAGEEGEAVRWVETGEHLPGEDPLQRLWMERGQAEHPAQARAVLSRTTGMREQPALSGRRGSPRLSDRELSKPFPGEPLAAHTTHPSQGQDKAQVPPAC